MASSENQSSGAGLAGVSGIIAALILGAAVVYGSSLVSESVRETAERLEGMRVAMTEMKDAMGSAAPVRQAAAPKRRGPDPAKVYEIKLNGAPVRGPEDAKITIVEFSDFQCPFCGRVSPTLDQVMKEYGDDVRIAFKNLPLAFHAKAPAAHAAAMAAGRQGKFWEMHDKIFENQKVMSPEKYDEWAQELGLDVAKFKKDAASAEVKKEIEADKQQAASLGVSGTPSFFVNGRFMSGAQPYSAFKAAIQRELNKKS